MIWSFWSIILLLGFPTWWATTSIYRASLPAEVMLAKHTDLWYSIPICIESQTLPHQVLAEVASRTETLAVGDQNLFKFQIQSQIHCPEDGISTIFRLEPTSEASIEYLSKSSSFHLGYIAPDIAQIATQLSKFLILAFLEEHASIAYQLFTNDRGSDAIQAFVQSMPQDIVGTVQRSANRAYKPSSEYHLTFSLFTAGSSPSSWAVQEALDIYIQPIVHSLTATTNFSVTSQVQLYSAFSPSIQPHQTEEGWRLRKEELTSFVNTAEWPLSPSIGSGPTTNFITYVPSLAHYPLLLDGSIGNAWLVPQWGGITILNPALVETELELEFKSLPEHLGLDSLIPAFENFRTHMLQLLGVPQSTLLPLPERLKSFRRLASLSLYIRTSSNLGSLARLAQHLNNIPIPRHVLRHVEHSLDQLSTYRQCLSTKTTEATWSSCLESVRTAFVDSEKAFFDKSMVGQVYFPDEHKVAVYLPLLGPIGVPLVIGLLRELKKFKARRTT